MRKLEQHKWKPWLLREFQETWKDSITILPPWARKRDTRRGDITRTRHQCGAQKLPASGKRCQITVNPRNKHRIKSFLRTSPLVNSTDVRIEKRSKRKRRAREESDHGGRSACIQLQQNPQPGCSDNQKCRKLDADERERVLLVLKLSGDGDRRSGSIDLAVASEGLRVLQTTIVFTHSTITHSLLSLSLSLTLSHCKMNDYHPPLFIPTHSCCTPLYKV